MRIRLPVLALLAAAQLAGADGLIIVNPTPGTPVSPDHFSFTPLEVKYHRVSVKIEDQVAVTSIDQAFHNPGNRRLEGTYVFPLPEGAHIDRFAMDVNGKPMEAELLDADKARKLYEDIVRKAKDPALLEYVGRGAFKVRIFPIEPHSTKPVSITYTQVLKSDNGLVEYVYPLNTEKFSAKPLQDVSVKVELRAKTPIKSIYCPSHHVDVSRHSDRHAVVGFEEKEARPDTDFKLVFSQHRSDIGIDLVTHRKGREEGYFMLMASPGKLTDRGAVMPKDICFVLDTSGSMMGKKLQQAKKALLFCVENMNRDDRFEIVRFSTEAESFFGKITPVTRASVAEASEFIEGLKPIGGTAIHEALTKALATRPPAARGRPYHIVFLTDGLPTIGETGEDAIVAAVAKADQHTRVFSFGLGTDVNTHLLDRIAEGTRAISNYVLPEEDLELKLSSFYTKIADPVMANVALGIDDSSVRLGKLYPHRLPDLFNGDQLIIFGSYRGTGSAVVSLSGIVSGEPRDISCRVTFSDQSHQPFVPAMWATRRIGWLLDEIRKQGESEELKDEVTALAREYGIVTPYTAYLIMEDEAVRNVPVARRNMRELEADGTARRRASSVYDSLQAEAAEEQMRSGQPAVWNSLDVKQLKYSSNRKQMKVGRGLAKSQQSQGSGYKTTRNYGQQVRTVNGRTFYQNGTVWNDSTAQSQSGLRTRRLQFNSDEYFDFLRKNSRAAPWLSLGQEVDVVVGDTLYEIR